MEKDKLKKQEQSSFTMHFSPFDENIELGYIKKISKKPIIAMASSCCAMISKKNNSSKK